VGFGAEQAGDPPRACQHHDRNPIAAGIAATKMVGEPITPNLIAGDRVLRILGDRDEGL